MTKLELSIMDEMDYETFVSIIAKIPSCIFFKDSNLKYRFSSHCWAQLIDDDIVGKTDLEIRKDTENAVKAMEADRAIIESKKGQHYVIKSDIDGEISHLELIKEPIMDASGEVIGIVGLINDVTQQTIMEKQIVDMSKMLEEQCDELETSNEELRATLEKVEQMHTAQKLFTASMNHELRSPLNGIIGNLQLLLEDSSLSREQSDIVKNAFNSSQMMLEIVNELLDFAKMEMGGFTIKQEPFVIARLLDNIEFSASTQAKAKGLEFSLIKDFLHDIYMGDEIRLAQIINNIVSNAIKYTEKGYIELEVAYENGMLKIVCADSGQGISADAMDTLFDPYTRFNEKKNAKIQGTGLGLSVVKGLVNGMNGEITVESKLGIGTTFTIRIPIQPASVEEFFSCENREDIIDVDNMDFGHLKVLCVDDSKVNLTMMAAMLNKVGINADEAFSGMQGIARADRTKYDVIFLDHMMPIMDGLETFDIIRKNSSLNFDTPIIMLSGNVDPEAAEVFKQHGAAGHLVKPVLKEKVLEMIARVTGMI